MKFLRNTCGKNEVVEAMKEEIDALKKSVTWELVAQNNDLNVIRYRWIYKVKYKFDDIIIIIFQKTITSH